MESLGHRRRLKKKPLTTDPEDSKSEFLIPKKHDSVGSKKRVESISMRSKAYGLEEDEDSLEEFITDKIEYFQDALPSSSEESAHSTDEENGIPRRHARKRPKTPSEDSAVDTESSGEDMENPERPPEECEADEAKTDLEKAEEKQEILLGKKALEAKRAKGLLPPKDPKPTSKKEKPPKKVKRPVPEVISSEKPRKRRKESEARGKYVQFAEFETPEDRKKAELVTKVLCRWWYVLEDWPPADFDYSEQLRSQKLRLVGEETWNVEPVVSSQGLEKVKPLANYPGLFQSSRGVIYDLRPQETCPCFDNLYMRPKKALRELLVKALERQLGELEAQPACDKQLSARLKRELAYEKGKLGL
jgi:hypothetical protein